MRIGATKFMGPSAKLEEFVLCIINVPDEKRHNQWQRVGVGKVTTPGYDGTRERRGIFKSCELEEIVLI